MTPRSSLPPPGAAVDTAALLLCAAEPFLFVGLQLGSGVRTLFLFPHFMPLFIISIFFRGVHINVLVKFNKSL